MTGRVVKKFITLGSLLAIGIVGLSLGCQKEQATTTETTTKEAPAPSGTQATTSTTTTTVNSVGQPTPK